MFSVEHLIEDRYPDLFQRHPRLAPTLVRLLRRLFKENTFQQFEQEFPHLQGFEFVEQVLDYFDFRYAVRDHERQRIPVSGRLVVVANHPIGSLDGLALLKLVREVRHDVKVVANDLLCALNPLHTLLLPVDNMGGKTRRRNVEAIHQHLDADGVVIIFPAGEVSRLGPRGIRDGKWNPGFLRMAIQSRAPILPVYVGGRNSILFYSVSLVAKPLSTALLVREMFNQAKNCVNIRIGEVVSLEACTRFPLSIQEKAGLFKHHLYRIAQSKPGIFSTEKAIAYPENRVLLRNQIRKCERLGLTADGKEIYLYRFTENSVVMREIGRLREIAFRAVGEGTGATRDIDRYDPSYIHLVLWDDEELEIAGAYRLRDASRVRIHAQAEQLYSATLFELTDSMRPYLERGIELGRSFVQPRYWGKRSLDYLWFGIGAFLLRHPEFRYLFGPVSLSSNLPQRALEMLIFFYSRHYPASGKHAVPRLPYNIPLERRSELQGLFPGADLKVEFATLKAQLAHMNLSVPTLYKQYTEVCEEGGAQFAGFNVDPEFANCVDGLIIVDLETIKPSRRKRYMPEEKSTNKENAKTAAA